MAKAKAGTKAKSPKAKRGGDPPAGQGQLQGAEHFAPPEQPAKAPASPARARGLSDEQAAAMTAEARERAVERMREFFNSDPGFAHLSAEKREEIAQAAANRPSNSVLSNEQLQASLREDFVCAWIVDEQLRLAGAQTKEQGEAMSVAVYPPRTPGARAALSPWTERNLTYAEDNQPAVVTRWIHPLLEDGPVAVLSTLADLLGTADLAELETNALSWIGNRVSYHLRRALLLRELEAADWNLGAVGAALRMGGAGNVTKAIRDLGLSDELEKARAAGKAKRGVKRG